MAYDEKDDEHKSAAQLQREVEGQRRRVESTIDEIQDKLSPGQLVDQLMSYTKSGGGDFAAGLGRSITANPLPVALLGVSLVWLMSGRGGPSLPTGHSHEHEDYEPYVGRGGSPYAGRDYNEEHYAGVRGVGSNARSYAGSDRSYGGGSTDDWADRSDWNTAGDWSQPRENKLATVTGSALQRVGHVTDDAGRRYSEFTDDAGKKFRALADEVGNRTGHFTDEAGNMYHGFVDSAGNAVKDFTDEAGNVLTEASGWASHLWQTAAEKLQQARNSAGDNWRNARGGAGERLHDARDGMNRAAGFVGRRANSVGSQVQYQANQMTRTVANVFDDQPLIGGAVAFAVGAAIGSALPRTRQEDQWMGDAADGVKDQASHLAGDLYEQGKSRAADAYAEVSDRAGELYNEARDKVAGAVDAAQDAIDETADKAPNTSSM